MSNVKLNRKESEKLFYEFKNLELKISSLKSIVQNPDFADSDDINIFLEECNNFEEEYKQIKNNIVKLYENKI